MRGVFFISLFGRSFTKVTWKGFCLAHYWSFPWLALFDKGCIMLIWFFWPSNEWCNENKPLRPSMLSHASSTSFSSPAVRPLESGSISRQILEASCPIEPLAPSSSTVRWLGNRPILFSLHTPLLNFHNNACCLFKIIINFVKKKRNWGKTLDWWLFPSVELGLKENQRIGGKKWSSKETEEFNPLKQRKVKGGKKFNARFYTRFSYQEEMKVFFCVGVEQLLVPSEYQASSRQIVPLTIDRDVISSWYRSASFFFLTVQ